MNWDKFYQKTIEERVGIVAEHAGLGEAEIELLKKYGSLDKETANRMIENVIGVFSLPLGIATNFLVNGKEYAVPMVLEEPSVVAAASNAAKLARSGGGFKTESTGPVMIGQIQFIGVADFDEAAKKIAGKSAEIIELANKKDSVLVGLGGGLKDIIVRKISTKRGDMVIVHLIVNVKDAMGANAVNTISEAVSPFIENLIGGKARLRIISNLADKRLVKATAIWKKEELGEPAIEGILDAFEFADNDQYRGTTHNKGIMNGIDSVCIATGNDFRALEAGAHSYACLSGRYRSLTKYWKDSNGDLIGQIELPLAVGVIGGSTKTNPMAKLGLKILGVKTSQELGEVMACVGLANNFAALRAMVTEGIQAGHMKLHAKNIAVTAGAVEGIIELVSEKIVAEKNINVANAKKVMGNLKEKKLVVFDLDGTLTPSKQPMDAEMSSILIGLLGKKSVAVIGGGSYKQFQNQFLPSLNCPENLLKKLFMFPTCSTSFYRYENGWKNIYTENMSVEEKQKILAAFKKALGEYGYKPEKLYGEMIEDRGTQITFSALGQEAPLELKEKWDPERRKREQIKSILEKLLPEFEVRMGGTTSIDVTRKGIDKAYGIKQIEKLLGFPIPEMLFIGDALYEGGNDYAVKQTGVDCIQVSGPEECKKVIKALI